MELAGLLNYFVFFLTVTGIYAVLVLGLNIQWGFTGQINIGVAAFFAVGAYASAIVTTAPSPDHLGGFGLPFLAGVLGAMAVAALLGLFVALITVNLRGDYLAIASIGIAEIVRLTLKNEDWLTNGVRGIPAIPDPVSGLVQGSHPGLFLLLVIIAVGLVFFAVERLFRSPWVRVLRAVRANEEAVMASGKSVTRFRIEAFVLGSAIMGLGGALYAHFTSFISPSAFEPMYGTFLVWVMLIAGGSGNNRGALLGTFIIWLVWSGTEIFTSQAPEEWITRISAIRIFLIGLILEIILILRPQGLLPERPPRTPGVSEGTNSGSSAE
ncbi:MAG: branched-chain amino acid ABC transporter permease [Desulfohalobiaceae bacterium]